jgi:hypothetical protein
MSCTWASGFRTSLTSSEKPSGWAWPPWQAKWQVAGKVKDKLVSERAQVEGCIGSVKSRKYGFNKPAASSARHA